MFEWSDAKQTAVVWAAVVPTIAALVVALVVLVLAGFIYADPRTRPSLRRQSLKMLLCVQLASLIYSGTYLGEMLITGPTPWCNACIILTLWTSNFIDFVIMLIPINLQLALVHGIRTEGWVRYYLGGSLLAATLTAVPGAVNNVWGWDPLSRICWIKTPDPRARNAWQVGAFYAWILLSMLVASLATGAVIVHLVRYTHAHDRKFVSTRSTSGSNGRILRTVAWRITLYPAVLVANNCVSAAANFMITSAGGINSTPTYVVWTASGFFYGALPLFYGLVALFVDPSFSRAVRTLLRAHSAGGNSSIEMGAGGGGAPTLAIEFERHVATLVDGASVHSSASHLPPSAPTPGVTLNHLRFGALPEKGRGSAGVDGTGGEDGEDGEGEGEEDGAYLAKGVEFLVSAPGEGPVRPAAEAPVLGRAGAEHAMARREAARSKLRADLDQL